METKDFEFEIIDPIDPRFIIEPFVEEFAKFNPNHDELGRFSAGGVGGSALPSSAISYEGNGVHNYKYGDFEFKDSTNLEDNVYDAYENWLNFAGSYQMRMMSASLMGLGKPKSEGDQELTDWTLEALATGQDNGEGNQFDKDNFRQALIDAHTIMNASKYGRTGSEMYRGITIPKTENGFDNLKSGTQFEMPLSAFTKNKADAGSFFSRGSQKGVIFKLLPNAKGYDNKNQGSGGFHEFITQGKFEVVGVMRNSAVTEVTIAQLASFDIATGKYDG